LSLDNVWDLRDFETSNLTMRLQVNVDRVHGGREILARAG